MLTLIHWLIEGGCLAVIAAGATVMFLMWGDGDAKVKAITGAALDREHVEDCYRAGGWDDYPRTGLPVYDSIVAERIDLMIWETERDIDAFTEEDR